MKAPLRDASNVFRCTGCTSLLYCSQAVWDNMGGGAPICQNGANQVDPLCKRNVTRQQPGCGCSVQPGRKPRMARAGTLAGCPRLTPGTMLCKDCGECCAVCKTIPDSFLQRTGTVALNGCWHENQPFRRETSSLFECMFEQYIQHC